ALPVALPSSGHVCSDPPVRVKVPCFDLPVRAEVPYSGLLVARAEGRPSVGAIAVAAAPARERRIRPEPTMRRLLHKVGLSSHTVLSSQAINSSRSAKTT